jgi:hypothetical protein
VGAFLKTESDVALIDEDMGGGVDEVAEDVLEFDLRAECGGYQR